MERNIIMKVVAVVVAVDRIELMRKYFAFPIEN